MLFTTVSIFGTNLKDKFLLPEGINTFVTFICLVLAVGGLSIRRRMATIIAGSSILFLTHASFTQYFNSAVSRGIESATFLNFWDSALGIATVALPLLLWVLLVPEGVVSFLPREEKPYYPCPICGHL